SRSQLMTLGTPPTTHIRYIVLGLTFGLAIIAYIDRICISVVAPAIMSDLNLTDFQMAVVFSSFTAGYALFHIPSGRWGDVAGPRRVLTLIVIGWSISTGATACVFDFASLVLVRFLFGVAQAGAWPNATKTFSRWFPPTERGR